MQAPILFLVLGIAALVSTPARADECAAVAQAYGLLAKTHAYHQVTTMPNLRTLEMVTIGDALYLKQGLDWRKVPIQPGMRVSMMNRLIPNAASLKDCALVGSEALAGQSMQIYEYTPPALAGVGSAGPQKVWIGKVDGLPHRMMALRERTDTRMIFEGVKPPIP